MNYDLYSISILKFLAEVKTYHCYFFCTQGQIESVMLIPGIQEALDVMQQPQNRPRNCSKAYTMSGDVVYEDRFYSGRSGSVSRYLKADVQDEIK